MSGVKVEINAGLICHGCLSLGRRTFPLGGFSDMYYSLVGPLQPYSGHNNDEPRLCWECTALLKRLKTFRAQLKTAQDLLLQNADVAPLSKLSTVYNKHHDYELEYCDLETKLADKIDTKLELATAVKEEITNDVDIYDETEIPDNDFDIPDNDYDTPAEYMCDTKDNIPMKIERTRKLKVVKRKLNGEKRKLKGEKRKLKGEKRKLKVEVEDSSNKKVKKEKTVSLVSKYRGYSRLLRTEKKDWGTNCEQYFTKAFLTEAEIESFLNQTERTQRSFANFPYKCEECSKAYLKPVDFYRHNDLNHHKAGTPYQCRMCKKVCPSWAALADHWRQHCSLYRCDMCRDYCRPRFLKRHLNQQHTKVYGCVNCRCEFGSLTKFAVHFKESHGTYTCDYCNKVHSEKRMIEKHIAHRHGNHYCSKCNRHYKNYTKYRYHLRLYHPVQLNHHENLELAYCVECDRQYPSVYKYKIHIKESPKHTPKVPVAIPCPECGKTFSRKSYMNNHYRHTHLKVTKFYCEPCNKYYANGYGLRHHRESVHLKLPKVKDKICDICGRGFHTNGVLIKHRRTHTGERPYQCSHCSASFAQSTACKTHMRTQHRHATRTSDIMQHLL